jgi:hypothetical protein
MRRMTTPRLAAAFATWFQALHPTSLSTENDELLQCRDPLPPLPEIPPPQPQHHLWVNFCQHPLALDTPESKGNEHQPPATVEAHGAPEIVWATMLEAQTRLAVSKVLSIVTFHCKCTRALTFENV